MVYQGVLVAVVLKIQATQVLVELGQLDRVIVVELLLLPHHMVAVVVVELVQLELLDQPQMGELVEMALRLL
jgi:hypothetical protein